MTVDEIVEQVEALRQVPASRAKAQRLEAIAEQARERATAASRRGCSST